MFCNLLSWCGVWVICGDVRLWFSSIILFHICNSSCFILFKICMVLGFGHISSYCCNYFSTWSVLRDLYSKVICRDAAQIVKSVLDGESWSIVIIRVGLSVFWWHLCVRVPYFCPLDLKSYFFWMATQPNNSVRVAYSLSRDCTWVYSVIWSILLSVFLSFCMILFVNIL